MGGEEGKTEPERLQTSLGPGLAYARGGGRASTRSRPAFLRPIFGGPDSPHQQVSGLTELQVPPQDGVQVGPEPPSLCCYPTWSWWSGSPQRQGGDFSFPTAEGKSGMAPGWDGCPSLAPRFP